MNCLGMWVGKGGSSCPPTKSQREMLIDYSPDSYWNLTIKLQEIVLVSLPFIIPFYPFSLTLKIHSTTDMSITF